MSARARSPVSPAPIVSMPPDGSRSSWIEKTTISIRPSQKAGVA